MIRHVDKGTTLSKLVPTYLLLTPHSIAPVISHHDNIKSQKRSTLSRQTINRRLIISLNELGTAFFDPREAVAKFMTSKNRRNRTPDYELYTNREFVKRCLATTATYNLYLLLYYCIVIVLLLYF